MAYRENDLSHPPTTIDLSNIRHDLAIPSLLTAVLAQRVGARLHTVRPGRAVVELDGSMIRIRVRLTNVYREEAKAYELIGQPVPQQVLDDIERWEREHGNV